METIMHDFFARPRFILCGLLIMLASLGTGCASSKSYGEQITTVNYYPECYAPLQALRDANLEFNKTVVVSTGVGIAAGALIGLLVSRKAEGALIGAAAGGLAGAGVGYAKAKQDRIADDNKRMASYLADLEGDISGIDRVTAAARTARDCYNRQFNQAIAGYKDGRMPREELTGRYEEIKNGITEADTILGAVIADAGDKERSYQEAVQSEARRAGRPVPVVAAAQSKPSGPEPVSKRSAAAKGKTGDGKPVAASAAGASGTAGAAGASAQSGKPIVQKTAAPRQGDHSLEAVARNTQRLGETRQSAIEEQEAIRKMQEEMNGTLATVLS